MFCKTLYQKTKISFNAIQTENLRYSRRNAVPAPLVMAIACRVIVEQNQQHRIESVLYTTYINKYKYQQKEDGLMHGAGQAYDS